MSGGFCKQNWGQCWVIYTFAYYSAFPANPEDSTEYPIYLTDEKPRAQRSERTCPRSWWWDVVEPGLEPTIACFQNILNSFILWAMLQFVIYSKNIKSFIETYHLGLYLSIKWKWSVDYRHHHPREINHINIVFATSGAQSTCHHAKPIQGFI